MKGKGGKNTSFWKMMIFCCFGEEKRESGSGGMSGHGRCQRGYLLSSGMVERIKRCSVGWRNRGARCTLWRQEDEKSTLLKSWSHHLGTHVKKARDRSWYCIPNPCKEWERRVLGFVFNLLKDSQNRRKMVEANFFGRTQGPSYMAVVSQY